jgi:hypothetical protein
MVYRNKHAVAEATGQEPDGTHGLKKRYEEMEKGRCGPGTDVWKTHEDQIRGLKDKLDRYINTFNNMKPPCEGGIPDDLQEWADKEPPSWKGDPNAPVPPECNKATAPAKSPANQPKPTPVPVPPAAPAPGKQDDEQPASSSSPDIAKAAVIVGEVVLGAVAVAAIVSGAPVLAGAAAAAAIVVGLGSLLGGGGSPDSA